MPHSVIRFGFLSCDIASVWLWQVDLCHILSQNVTRYSAWLPALSFPVISLASLSFCRADGWKSMGHMEEAKP
ncbi:hypothetical protein LEMLEM_LOCUS11131 [Lemmus lemmus]